MSNLRVLLTITDGVDNSDDMFEYFYKAVNALQSRNIFSLSCGIGDKDVDHDRLNMLAAFTNGLHIQVSDSEDIIRSVDRLRDFMFFSIASTLSIQKNYNSISIQQTNSIRTAKARLALDIFILIDRSWSMVGLTNDNTWTGDKYKLQNAKEAATKLICSLDSKYDRVGLGCFDSSWRILFRPTSDFVRCIRFINQIKCGNGTSIYKSIYNVAGAFDPLSLDDY